MELAHLSVTTSNISMHKQTRWIPVFITVRSVHASRKLFDHVVSICVGMALLVDMVKLHGNEARCWESVPETQRAVYQIVGSSLKVDWARMPGHAVLEWSSGTELVVWEWRGSGDGGPDQYVHFQFHAVVVAGCRPTLHLRPVACSTVAGVCKSCGLPFLLWG